MLKNKHILIGISGGIAAYKTAELVSRLKKEGADVKVIFTKNAAEFITPSTIAAITNDEVYTSEFPSKKIDHINLADWADIFAIVPATANTIAKIANGIADNLLTTTMLAFTKKKLIVPAMNVNMFKNPIVQKNIKILEEYGFVIMPPDSGKLACGYSGLGRLPEPLEISYFIKGLLQTKRDLQKHKILITAGATIEKIDPMRFITNHSSGKMGLALARCAFIKGADVTLIAANIKENIPQYLKVIKVNSTQDMYQEVLKIYKNFDIIIKAAAVSDYTPVNYSKNKIKKANDLTIELKRTKDILFELGKLKTNQILIGFAAESENILSYAKQKMETKNLDFIIANKISVASKNETDVWLINKIGEKTNFIGSKFDVAIKILDKIKNEI